MKNYEKMLNYAKPYLQEKFEPWFKKHMKEATYRAIDRYNLEAGENRRSTYNNQADAFKHAYMQCWLAYRFGDKFAEFFGDDHETSLKGNPSDESNMDLWNNRIGREIAHEIKKEYGSDIHLAEPDFLECVAFEKIIQKMNKGELITNPYTDKRRYTNMEKERIKDKDRVFYDGEYWDKLNDDERKRYSEVYTKNRNENMKTGFPTKEELDKKVISGELIYVENYTRSDGTKVSGYYRRKPVH